MMVAQPATRRPRRSWSPNCTYHVMLSKHCSDCDLLFGQMRATAQEACAIARNARIMIHATRPSAHVDEWEQMREQWEKARRSWLAAARNLNSHLSHAG